VRKRVANTARTARQIRDAPQKFRDAKKTAKQKAAAPFAAAAASNRLAKNIGMDIKTVNMRSLGDNLKKAFTPS